MKRNRVQLVIALLCLLLLIKQMDAPFLVEYNMVTSLLFEQVASDSAGGELLDMLNDLGFAYYSSLVFYFVVDYFPSRQKERKAFLTVQDHLSWIQRYIDQLFSDLLFISGIGNEMDDLKGNMHYLFKIMSLELDENPIYVNRTVTNRLTGEFSSGSTGEKIIPYADVQKNCETICAEINKVLNHPGASELEKEIVEILSTLSENRYIKGASSLDPDWLKQGIRSFVIRGTFTDLEELVWLHVKLCELPITQYKCVLTRTSKSELEELARLYESLSERDKKRLKIKSKRKQE